MTGEKVSNYAGQVITEIERLKVTRCGVCQCLFAMLENKYDRCLEDGGAFYCPNGCRLVFRNSKAEKLERELEAEKRVTQYHRNRAENERSRANKAKKQAAAYKGVVTRTKKRIQKGVCPCCNRHFVNLQRHMEGQHPEYTMSDN